MTRDRVTRITIEGLRVLEKVQLDLGPMTVLIGDNGTGKSSVIEALEMLHEAADSADYLNGVLDGTHGPFNDLLSHGRNRMKLGVRVEGNGYPLDYSFAVTLSGRSCAISHETLLVFEQGIDNEPLHALIRTPQKTQWFDESKRQLVDVADIVAGPQTLVAANAAKGLVRQEAFVRLVDALRGIECHPPFDVRPLWQQEQLQTKRSGPRWPSRPNALKRVPRYGSNLPAVLMELRNENEKWKRFKERATSAVGVGLIDIRIQSPQGQAGQIEVRLEFKGRSEPLPLECLSEGQLSYLIMLAVVEMGGDRTVLALDEPDIHYHPELVVNLVQILEDLSIDCPVVIATHSDRLLDALESPAASVLLCDLDDRGAASLRRPDARVLGQWLEKYRGLGAVRADGYERHVFEDRPIPQPVDEPEDLP